MCSWGQPHQTVFCCRLPSQLYQIIRLVYEQSLIGSSLVLLNSSESSWILLDPAGSSWILLDSTGSPGQLLKSSGSYQVVARHFSGSQSIKLLQLHMSINFCAAFATESLFSLFLINSMTLFYGHFCSKSVEIDRFLLTQGSLSHP